MENSSLTDREGGLGVKRGEVYTQSLMYIHVQAFVHYVSIISGIIA